MNFEKFLRPPFSAEHHQAAASDYSSIDSNSNEGRIGKSNLLRSTLHVKQQVSEAVVRRFLKISP